MILGQEYRAAPVRFGDDVELGAVLGIVNRDNSESVSPGELALASVVGAEIALVSGLVASHDLAELERAAGRLGPHQPKSSRVAAMPFSRRRVLPGSPP